MSTMVMDSNDFAQVPSSSSFGADALSLSGEDWLSQLQVLDLPQLFSFKDAGTPTSDFSSEELDDFAKKVDINTLEELLVDVATPEAQHEAPGPIRTPPTKVKDSPMSHTPKSKTAISISREDLLKFTSEDLEAYVKAITATRSLTTAENKEIKRQRRLIKNRESAQQSRKRKKDKVGDLEAQVAQLESVNEDKMAKLEEVQAEHVILKAEVTQLVNVIKDSPALSTLLMNVTSWMVMYTLSQAVNQQNIQQTIIPPVIQQKMLQLPITATRAIC